MQNDHINVCLTNSNLVEIELLKQLHDANAPHYLFQNILEWAKWAKELNYDFHPELMQRRSQINHLEKWLGLEYLRPKQVEVKLPGLTLPGYEDEVSVTCFDFASMLQSLLTDKELFGCIDNLDVNYRDPFLRYKGRTAHISCANGSMGYTDAWKSVCKIDKDFMVPIIFACDEMTMHNSSAYPCCSVPPS